MLLRAVDVAVAVAVAVAFVVVIWAVDVIVVGRYHILLCSTIYILDIGTFLFFPNSSI